MPDDMNDDFEIDTSELENLPADAVEDTDDATDDDFDFAGLTDDEIAAINSDEGDDEQDEDTEVDTDNDSDAGDEDTADTTNDDAADDYQDNWQAEAATVADKRTAIDTEFDAKLAELEALGEQYDNGDILDGAYNTAKTRIEREMKRIEVREAELVTKEDAIAERETSQQEQFQTDFAVAVTSFMDKPENAAFIEGSPEFAALDQQLGMVAQSMPPGTPFDVLLDKARAAVSSYMAIEPMGKKGKSFKQDPETMPSISNMPAVVANTNEGNKFAHLDKLDGPALERAISDMNEAQQAEYLTQ